MQQTLDGTIEIQRRKKRKDPDKPRPPRERRSTKDQDRKAAFWANQIAPAHDEETTFRHSNWRAKRELVRKGLAEVNTSESALARFDNCGSECVVEICPADQRLRVRANYCHCRHCQPCQAQKGNLLAANLRKRLERQADGRYRFVTLTLKHSTEPLTDQIKKLYASFTKLRKSHHWKSSQVGGCAILEVKWSPKTREWHPHLHVITEGEFLAVKSLSQTWLAITGDSHIVDIRSLNEGKDAAHYVSKYVGKGTNDELWSDPDARQEWITATKGVRTAATYGTWRGFKLLAHPKDEKVWKPIGTLYRIIQDAREGQPYAQALVSRLHEEVKYNPHRSRRKVICTPEPQS